VTGGGGDTDVGQVSSASSNHGPNKAIRPNCGNPIMTSVRARQNSSGVLGNSGEIHLSVINTVRTIIRQVHQTARCREAVSTSMTLASGDLSPVRTRKRANGAVSEIAALGTFATLTAT
jgi:hypothetical protein